MCGKINIGRGISFLRGAPPFCCRALRDIGKEAYLLPNPEITVTYAPYAAPYWAPEGWEPSFVVSVDIAALSLLPENAKAYAGLG